MNKTKLLIDIPFDTKLVSDNPIELKLKHMTVVFHRRLATPSLVIDVILHSIRGFDHKVESMELGRFWTRIDSYYNAGYLMRRVELKGASRSKLRKVSLSINRYLMSLSYGINPELVIPDLKVIISKA
jgi:hypothetical protein